MKGFTSNPAGAWSTGGNLNTARAALGGAGDSSNAIGFGGSPPPAPTAKDITEQYNGSTWSEVADLNTKRAYLVGAGVYNSAIGAGGDQLAGVTESWNGTCWTEVTDMGRPAAGIFGMGSAGVDNESALYFGGPSGTSPVISGADETEQWNGSSWTELNDLNNARIGMGGVGIVTAALGFGGGPTVPSLGGLTESWNGTCWTNVNALNTKRRYGGSSGQYTSAVYFAGLGPPRLVINESWNGTSWSETTDMSTARDALGYGGYNGGVGTATGIAFGGDLPGDSAATEEWVSPVTSTVTFTAS
jgi:hypothetical protein